MEPQSDSQQAANQKQEEQHQARMASDFDYMCMHSTQGRLNLSLFPQDYESLGRFEKAFREAAFEFNPTKRASLRTWYQRKGFSRKSAEKKIVIRLLGRVMDLCENRGFDWPRGLLKVESDLLREIASESQEDQSSSRTQESPPVPKTEPETSPGGWHERWEKKLGDLAAGRRKHL